MAANLSSVERILYKYHTSENAKKRYRFWHVESLLNQAADLLDRCLRDRAEFRAIEQGLLSFRLEKNTDAFNANRQKAIRNNEPGFSAENRRSANISYIRSQFVGHYRTLHERLEKAEALVKSETPAGLSYSVERLKTDMESALNNIEITYADAIKSREDSAATRQDELIRHLDHVITEKDSFYMKGGAVSILDQRKAALERRITDDFKDAFDRLTTAMEGMEKIYGYRYEPLPTNDPSVDGFEQVDAALMWLRSAIRWLVAFGQLDQAWTAVFSVKELMKVGGLEWSKAITDAGTEAELLFAIPEKYFESHTYARLRGMVMFGHFDAVSPDASHMPLTAVVTLPKVAVSLQLDHDNPEKDPISITIIQDDVPPCYFGRIERPNTMRLPEVVGSVSLMNASPIQKAGSKWKLRLSAPQGYTFKYLRDVTIELNMVGRPRRLRE